MIVTYQLAYWLTYLLSLSPSGLFFPVASASNYVILRGVITSPLTALTVCFWMRTNDTTIEGTPLSYSAKATGGDDNEILMFDYRNFVIRINHEATG